MDPFSTSLSSLWLGSPLAVFLQSFTLLPSFVVQLLAPSLRERNTHQCNCGQCSWLFYLLGFLAFISFFSWCRDGGLDRDVLLVCFTFGFFTKVSAGVGARKARLSWKMDYHSHKGIRCWVSTVWGWSRNPIPTPIILYVLPLSFIFRVRGPCALFPIIHIFSRFIHSVQRFPWSIWQDGGLYSYLQILLLAMHFFYFFFFFPFLSFPFHLWVFSVFCFSCFHPPSRSLLVSVPRPASSFST